MIVHWQEALLSCSTPAGMKSFGVILLIFNRKILIKSSANTIRKAQFHIVPEDSTVYCTLYLSWWLGIKPKIR